jgi:predicted RNase H-like HicB family nuclease
MALSRAFSWVIDCAAEAGREVRGGAMLSRYIQAAMRYATYRQLPESDLFFFEIPPLPGVWASAVGIEEGMAELQEVLEDWIELGLTTHQHIPVIDGIDINLEQAAGITN